MKNTYVGALEKPVEECFGGLLFKFGSRCTRAVILSFVFESIFISFLTVLFYFSFLGDFRQYG